MSLTPEQEAAIAALVESQRPLIEMTGKLHEENTALRQQLSDRDKELAEARGLLTDTVTEIAELMGESKGVYGLHLNGDPAPWSEIDDGGRFEGWLTKFNAAREWLSSHSAASKPASPQGPEAGRPS